MKFVLITMYSLMNITNVISLVVGQGMSQQSVCRSIVAKLPYDWLYFDEMTRMHRAVQVRCVTALPAVAVALLAGSSLSVDEDNFCRSNDQASCNKEAFDRETSDRCVIFEHFHFCPCSLVYDMT